MGCLSSTDGKNDFEANEDFEEEEKEMKPTNKLSQDAEMGLPDEMNINKLDAIMSKNNPTQPLKSPNIQITPWDQPSNNNNQSIAGSNNRRGGQMNAGQSSILNNFNQNAPKNYDINQYNNNHYVNNANNNHMTSPHSDQASTASKDSSNGQSMGGVPEHRMMDSRGDVHVNKFYNVTRNHNLSNASKMTDMSEMPSVAHMQHGGNGGSDDNLNIAGFQHMQKLAVANNGGYNATHKMSIDSATTNGSKMLWDDFSERGSVMTDNTSTV